MRTGARQARGSSSWGAFGSVVVLRTVDPARITVAESAVRRELSAIDLACSRFRADSELTALNENPGHKVAVGPLLFEAVELALRAAALTDGAVDPTVGRCLQQAGYDRDWSLISKRAAAEEAPAVDELGTGTMTVAARMVAGWRSVRLDRRNRRVSIPHGVVLDLGATAKAWAADRAATAAAAASGCSVLVGIGGDLAIAGPVPENGWVVRVTDDHRSAVDAPGQTIQLSTGGLATSSTAVRRWRHRGREMHHVIDPATRSPARTPWRTVSVAAATCADANIAATAVLVKRRPGAGWLRTKRLPARLVDTDGEILYLSGWPQEASQ